MARHLYEALGVHSEATSEEIRKAYRKKALETHPDKLPPGATETERCAARERFHLVSNAYEVISDAEKRAIYDRHGEFPPPEVQESYADFFADMQTPFQDPFSSHPFMRSSRPRAHADSFFGFTDPFSLFDQIFGDLHRHFDDPFFSDVHPRPSRATMHRDPFNPFGHAPLVGGMFMGSSFGMFPPSSAFNLLEDPFRAQSAGFSSNNRYSREPSGNGRWVSQSRMTRSVNGVTETVWRRKDYEGNDHITYSYPDGTERYIFNGVEQPLLLEREEQQSPPLPPPQFTTGTQIPIDYRPSRRDTQQSVTVHDSAHVKQENERRSGSSHHRSRDHHEPRDDHPDSQRTHVEHQRTRHEPQKTRYEPPHEPYEDLDHHKKRWWSGGR